MEDWRRVWREGFAPRISKSGLEALAKGLREDDPALLQNTTVREEASLRAADMGTRVCGACAIAYCGWKGDGWNTYEEVTSYFRYFCDAAEIATGGRGRRNAFLWWFDGTPREKMIRELLPEVELALAEREAVSA